MIEPTYLKYLLEQYSTKSLTVAERDALRELLAVHSQEELLAILHSMDLDAALSEELSDAFLNERLAAVFARLAVDTAHTAAEVKPRGSVFWRRYWPFTAVAALLLMALTFYWYIQPAPLADHPALEVVDVAPAQPQAHIQMENGEQLVVSLSSQGVIYEGQGLKVSVNMDGQLVYEQMPGQEVSSKPSYLTVITPKGGFTKVKLHDGTMVELKPASSLRYPTVFSADKREVYLEGDAFFQVSPDAVKPFFVHSKKQSIEVLGTTFNLSTRDSYAKTLLLEGSVRIEVQGKSYILKPGQQALVANDVKVSTIENEVLHKWENDKFVFDNTSFVDILKEIENWYDVQMVFTQHQVDDIALYGTISKTAKLSDILKVLTLNTNYTFQIQGRRVIVSQH